MAISARVIYLNEAASAWPRAPGVAEAMAAEDALPLAVPGRTAWQRRDVRWECRTRLAALLGGLDPSRIALVPSATQALNLSILGLRLPRGAEVVTSCAEHNSVLRPLLHLSDRKRIHLTIVGLDHSGAIDRETFAEAMRRGPALVALTHASNVTGRVFDVAALFRQANAVRAVTLLDASQTLGHIPVDPQALHADLVAFAGHRGLRGPIGLGGLYVAPHIDLSPRAFGAVEPHEVVLPPLPEMPLCLEPGTPDVPSLAGLCAALDWWEQHAEGYQQQATHLTTLLRAGLKRIAGVQCFDASGRGPRVPIVSFRVAGWGVDDLARALVEQFGVHSRAGLHCAPLVHKAIGSRPEGTVRFSLSGVNTEEEVGDALRAVRELAIHRPV